MAVKSALGYRLSLAVLPRLFHWLARLLFATCRISYVGREDFEERMAREPVIVTLWHFSLFLFIDLAKGRQPVAAMVSASKDGEYVARLLQCIGMEPVRGSSGRGGAGALKKMIRRVREGRSVVLVADGSKGPALQVQPGAILLASRTGVPIIPLTWAADRYLAARSWDRTVLPKPFARITVFCGAPLHVPGELEDTDLEMYRVKLEQEMLALYADAWGTFDKAGH